jgi:hypothetical protein
MSTPPPVAPGFRESKRRAVRWIARLCTLLLALAAAYFLSFGPAVMLAQRRIVSTDKVINFYSPLETATLVIPGANRLLQWYMGFWSVDDPAP